LGSTFKAQYTPNIFYDKIYPKALNFELGNQKYQNNSQGATLNYLLDSFHISSWSSNSNDWILQNRILYKINNQGLIENSDHYIILNNSWNIVSKFINTYDLNNFLIKHEISNWNSTRNKLVTHSKTEYTNNMIGKPIQELNYSWSLSSAKWNLASKTNNIYDSNSKRSESYTQVWKVNSNQFINSRGDKSSYNSNLKIDTWLFLKWDTMNKQWINEIQYIYKYDTLQNEILELQNWNINTLSWEKESLTKYSYDQNNKVNLTIRYIWINNEWLETFRRKSTNSYDTNLNLINVIEEDWDFSTQTYTFSGKFDYFYSQYNIISNTESEEKSSITISPNPCQDFITINGLTQSSQVSIFDLQSNQIQVQKDNDKIDLSNINSGIYFLRIRNENENQTFKIIKL
jgi:hypothetical protein